MPILRRASILPAPDKQPQTKLFAMRLTVPRLDGHTVLVVGDIMLDRYWDGDGVRISQEAPVPVVHVTRHSDHPGGAANVALNVVALGAACVLVGAVGADEAAEVLRARLLAAGVQLDLIIVPGWPTTMKLRVVSHHQQLIRLDFETPLGGEHQRELLRRVDRWADVADVAILQDYDKGALLEPEAVVQLLKRRGVRMVVDPKHKPVLRYAGADVVKPNFAEFQRNVGDVTGEDDFTARGQELLRAGGFQGLLVTRGERGMTLLERDAPASVHVPARTVRVFDVTGAGDTVAAALGVALASGLSLLQAAALANVAAGIAVANPGTVAVTGPQLRQALHEDEYRRGVVTREHLLAAVEDARRAGQRVVFTNGCFDILHAGHVGYLDEARQMGDRLIVAVNSDDSVRRLKGAGRPLNPLAARMAVLAGLAAVDWVVPFDEDTPERLLVQLQPHVLVKGGDYRLDEVVGADLMLAWQGEVRVLALREDCSTSRIVARARAESDPSAPTTGNVEG